MVKIMSDEKKERRTKVLCKVNCYLASNTKKATKVPKGMAVLMSAEEIKHFGKAVTKDVPDDAETFERG